LESKNGQDEKSETPNAFGNKLPEYIERPCGGVIKPDIVFFGESLPKVLFFITLN